MKFKVYLLILSFVAVIGLSAFAQNDSTLKSSSHAFGNLTITGRVINHADKKPVAEASVFFSNTTVGGITADDGVFTLHQIKTGKYQMIVSIVGFGTYSQTVIVNNSNITLPDIEVLPQTKVLQEVVIMSKVDPNRQRNYNWFKDEFLGTSQMAEDCKILNPEVIDLSFNDTTSTLTASSYDFIQIQNDALGYKIKYLLTNFTKGFHNRMLHYEGSPLFETMKGTPQQETRWKKKRQEAYLGSQMHFLRSLYDNKIAENGFRVLQWAQYQNPERPSDSIIAARIKLYKNIKPESSRSNDSLSFWNNKAKMTKMLSKLMSFPLNRDEITKETEQAGIYALGCDMDELHITYDKGQHFRGQPRQYNLDDPTNRETSVVGFNEQYAFFDNNGWLINPGSISLGGVWVKKRIAELLPEDYEPSGNVSDQLISSTLLQPEFSKLQSAADSVNKVHPVEKVYLHLNKAYYNPSDTIWFKAYVVVGELHQLSALSSVLYCELINNKDSIIERHTLKLEDGTAPGDFVLTSSLKVGSCRIRAYTNWMRNAGSSYFYDQPIKIGRRQIALISARPALATKKPDIQFFPEGGELVNRVRSRVAVKAVSSSELGENVSGIITDNEGNNIAAFETQHLGMGVFALIPKQGETYKVTITAADSSTFTVNLPEAKEAGFTLTINNSAADSIYVKVAANDKLFQSKQNSLFYLTGQSGGKIYYSAAAKLVGPVFTVEIAKSRFPSGIVQFTLFSETGEPLNERIVFVRSDDTLKLKLSSAEKTYTTRQKVKIDLDATGVDNQPVLADLSVAVINETRTPVDENVESTILNNILLTSDLRGYIEQPNYYFNNASNKTAADLDLLMLTQGYRKFEWKQALSKNSAPIAYLPERDLELSGSIKTPSGKPVPNGKVMLISLKDSFSKDTTTNVDGDFKFSNLELSDVGKVVLRARKQNNGDNVTIYVKQPDKPAILKRKVTDSTSIALANLTPEQRLEATKNYEEYQNQQKHDSLQSKRGLKEVNITANKIVKPDKYNNYGTSFEFDVNMKKMTGQYNSVNDALRFVVPGLRFENNKYIFDRAPVQVMIDDFVHPQDDLDAFSPLEIDNIRIIEKSFTGPARLMVTTRRYAGTDTLSKILKEVVIKTHKVDNKPDMSHSANLLGGGNADQVLMSDKLIGCISLADCLVGKLFGVIFQNGIPYNTRATGHLSGTPRMQIIYDGVQLDGSMLNTLDAENIYSIEVLRSGANVAIYGSEAPGGLLIITSKRGVDVNYVTNSSPSGLLTYPFKGYYKARTYYLPKYTHPKTDIESSDTRSSIYWNPLVITDNNGKASFEYYNADTKGTYRVVIEGIDNNGNLGRQVYKYKVE